jgi:hypothetical protein
VSDSDEAEVIRKKVRRALPVYAFLFGIGLVAWRPADWAVVVGSILLFGSLLSWVLAGLRGAGAGRSVSHRGRSDHEDSAPHIPQSGAGVVERDYFGTLASEAVDRAFSDEPDAYVEQYLSELRGAWLALTAMIARTAILLVVLMLLFYLLTLPGTVSHVGLGPFQIDDLDLVAKLLPVVTAYLFYELVLMGLSWEDSRRVFRILMERQHPGVHLENLDTLVQPRMRAFIGQTDQWYPILGKGLWLAGLHKAVFAYFVPLAVAFLLPLAFQVVAYIHLFNRSTDLVTTVGAILSAALLLLTVSLIPTISKRTPTNTT